MAEKSTDDYERFLIGCGFEHWKVYLHMHQQYLGRVYAAAKRPDASGFCRMASEDRFRSRAMQPDERAELFEKVMPEIQEALCKLWQPDKFNYAELENEWEHLHLHLIPRYKAPREFGGIVFVDSQWGKNYAPYDKNFKVPEETLLRIKNEIDRVIWDGIPK